MSTADRRALIGLAPALSVALLCACGLNTSGTLSDQAPAGSVSSQSASHGAGGADGATAGPGAGEGQGGSGGVGGATADGGAGGMQPPVAVCGDGVVTSPEACDDSNTADNDACTSDCSCGANIPKSRAFKGPDDGHCYVFVESSVTFVEAAGACNDAGFYLAAITTEDERAFIADKFDPSVWIGGTDAVFDTWGWLNFEAWNIRPCSALSLTCNNGINLWAQTEPNGGDSENCLQYNSDDKFNDLACNSTMPFLCEKSP